MGLLDGLLGNASAIPTEVAQEKFGHLIIHKETIDSAYVLIRDYIIFTSKRLILVDVQGMTGSKIEYQSIPYRSIIRFSIESAGHMDLDADLKLYLTGGT